MLTEGRHLKDHYTDKWIVMSNPSTSEKETLFNSFGLPSTLYNLKKEKTMASMQSCHTPLGEEGFLLHIPLWTRDDFSRMKDPYHSLTAYVAPDITLIWTDEAKHENTAAEMEGSLSGIDFIYKKIMAEYANLSSVLDELQVRIVETENQTKDSANRDVLLQLTNLEQEVVIASSRLDDYEESLNRLLSYRLVETRLSVNNREEIRLAIKKAHYRIHLYRDLLGSTSGLLSDSIDNKLNNIMQYLQTWALVISVPTLIFSLFGINTSGMIGRETSFSSWIVIIVAVLLGAVTAWWLRKKEFK